MIASSKNIVDCKIAVLLASSAKNLHILILKIYQDKLWVVQNYQINQIVCLYLFNLFTASDSKLHLKHIKMTKRKVETLSVFIGENNLANFKDYFHKKFRPSRIQ